MPTTLASGNSGVEYLASRRLSSLRRHTMFQAKVQLHAYHTNTYIIHGDNREDEDEEIVQLCGRISSNTIIYIYIK